MGAFEKVRSGFPDMDGLLDHIRTGDNVVWRVGSIEEFRYFAKPFARQAVKEGRNLIYMRFASHEPILEPEPGIKIREFDPDKGFEAFTVDIYNCITREGREAFYVFDSLSSLQSVWYTDLMMGNFFRVTCPYLFKLDTVAYFPLLRGKHSFHTVSRIRDTTQLLLDVHSGEELYLHPLKVWNRYTPRMFLPHCMDPGSGNFRAVEDGVSMSRYYQLLEEEEIQEQDQSLDSYDRFFSMARMEYRQGRFSERTQQQIVESTMTKDPRLQEMIKEYFDPRDYFLLRDRMAGSGSIGGKACGMLLARKIVQTRLPWGRKYLEPHDSYYIGSDVFYTYIVSNNCWEIRIAQRTEEGYFAKAEDLRKALLSGEFPADIREKFRSVLEYFGQSPIIVRSSSFLEDGFGNAFAGKYESVFCVNQGTPKERMREFEQAVRRVYASTMDPSALQYRRQRGLEGKDEQMAVLVQRVSGSYQGDYFFPAAAGVGYSYSAYRWRKDMDPSAGLLRIVAGLGTRAVDRTERDYPRLAGLDRPEMSMHVTAADKHRFCQRNMDVLDIRGNCLKTVPTEELLDQIPLWLKKEVMERDYEAEDALKRMNRPKQVWFVTCQHLLENQEFTRFMQAVLKILEEVYGNPVDIEYTVNLNETGRYVVNLLQCRPLYTGSRNGKIDLPDFTEKEILVDLQDSSVGNSVMRPVDLVIRVDARAYYEYPYHLKSQVAEAIGEISRRFSESGKNLLLLAPGRIGTSSPELGVPVTFSDISGFSGICEVSDKTVGYMPELSYGSHMFQDLVEADIYYAAVWNDSRTKVFHPELLDEEEDLFSLLCPERKELSGMIQVTMPEYLYYWNDVMSGRSLCGRYRKENDKKDQVKFLAKK